MFEGLDLFHHLPGWPSDFETYTRGVSEAFKVWGAISGLALLLVWARLKRPVAIGLLALLSCLSVGNYTRYSREMLVERVDTYDVIHYYLNARYFDELGYFDLYPAIVAVDVENNGPYFKGAEIFLDQDETGHHLQPIGIAVQKGKKVKERFTPERWAQFSHDFLYLQRKMKGLDAKEWAQMLSDHGFNGTVVWTMVARPFATYVDVEYIKYLCYIDVFLLALAVGAVVWAYGGVPALWLVFFLTVTYSTRWPTISWAFFRYDYVSALVIAMCALKKGRPFLAGLLTGYAGTVRLFPTMWLYGPGMQGIFELLKKKLHRPALILALGFAAGAATLQGLATLEFGPQNVVTHFENMEDHNKSENLSSRRIGLALAMIYKGELALKIIGPLHKQSIEEQRPYRNLIAFAIMVGLGWGFRKRGMDEAFAFGFLPFYLLTTASYYYYVTRATLWVLHAANLDQKKHRVGLGFLIGMELFSNWAETEYPKHRFFLIGSLAWIIGIYALTMTLWYLYEDRQALKGTLDPQSTGPDQLSSRPAGRDQPQPLEGDRVLNPTDHKPEPA